MKKGNKGIRPWWPQARSCTSKIRYKGTAKKWRSSKEIIDGHSVKIRRHFPLRENPSW